MFELKYNITESDMRAANKRIMLFYFLLYLCVAVAGIAVGVTAVVLGERSSVFVLGIIILVFSGILFVLAMLMAFVPKNYVTAALPPSDKELDVVIDKTGVTVNGEHLAAFADLRAVKRRGEQIWVYIGSDEMLIVKPNILSGQTADELFAYMTERQGKMLLVPQSGEAAEAEKTEKTDPEK